MIDTIFNLRFSDTLLLHDKCLQDVHILPSECWIWSVLVKCIGVKYIGALSVTGIGEQKGHKFEASLATLQVPANTDESFQAKVDSLLDVLTTSL